ncbi:Zinc finger FYVE domain-containing protein 1 [Fragariocoptes setiger]|uniref:Zinc finger FYVE domain-containing protein 1 n=1 Tax=Fragariocoptes setiger TaxID=1670756 RepID=A0ABQ7S8A2_9ACAR|nr:Zinc finger FYVE domain-containing protein 1 [Fragariocoptes setiger]
MSASAINGGDDDDGPPKSFLLIDENEFLQCTSAEEFANKLGCQTHSLVKVVSIFGSIGHGKSFTLNHTFFNNEEVFKTSSTQDSCTIGIWAAYDPKRKVITIDTEGLLGVSANCQRRTRLLLKVLAISEIVIYRTRSERLEDNLFTFLGDASRVYVQHFSKELKNACQKMQNESLGYVLSDPGPVVIIFHETRDTEPLTSDANQTRESIIRCRFTTLGLTTEAFSAIEYVGIQTPVRPTSFDLLKQCIKRQIKNSSARTPRPVSVVYATLRVLNEKFNGDIEKTVPSMFSTQHLTCSTVCLSCNARCINSMNHHRDGQPHHTDKKCKYQYQFNNHVLYCRACYERGDEVIVKPKTCSSTESPWLGLAKYAWAGYVLECSRCGVIFRSRQYWFGNKDPSKYMCDSSVRTEIKHVWPGELNSMQASQNAAQRVLDSVSYFTETVTSISAKPTKMVSEWVADQIAPTYWVPNSRILHCALCGNEFGQFDQKHHCRLCGNGLCSTCSSKSKPVPERGWGETSVRVCDRCYESSGHLSGLTLASLPPLPPQNQQSINNDNNCNNNISSSPENHFLLSNNSKNNNINNCNRQLRSSAFHITNGHHQHRSSDTTNIAISNGRTDSSSSDRSNANETESSSASGSPKEDIDSAHQQNYHSRTTNTELKHSVSANYQHNNNDQSQHLTNGGAGLSPTSDAFLARKLGEALQSTLKTAIDYPLGVIKESARPEYWMPDSQITNCGLCKRKFNETVTIHHCRRCGGGFCSECSSRTKPVPERGWADASVRVCDKCYDEP